MPLVERVNGKVGCSIQPGGKSFFSILSYFDHFYFEALSEALSCSTVLESNNIRDARSKVLGKYKNSE